MLVVLSTRIIICGDVLGDVANTNVFMVGACSTPVSMIIIPVGMRIVVVNIMQRALSTFCELYNNSGEHDVQ